MSTTEPTTTAEPATTDEPTAEPTPMAEPATTGESTTTAEPATTDESTTTGESTTTAEPKTTDAGEQPPASAKGGPPAADLRAAAGLGEPGPRRRSGARRRAVIAGALLLAVAVVCLMFLGQQNRRIHHLVCSDAVITPARGRGFPPWGHAALAGPAWRPVAVAPGAPCTSQTFDSQAALARRFGELLLARVDAWVLGHADGTGSERLADVQAQLDQAGLLLDLGAAPGAPALADARRALAALQGDLAFFHARDRVQAAAAALDEAAAQLDQAMARGPRHSGADAGAWQRWLAHLRQELATGPRDTTAPADAPDGAAGPAPADVDHLDGSAASMAGAAQDAGVPAAGVTDAGPGQDAAQPDPAAPLAPTPVPPAAPPRKAPVPRGGQLI